jgi:hypothetical protein
MSSAVIYLSTALGLRVLQAVPRFSDPRKMHRVARHQVSTARFAAGLRPPASRTAACC